MTVPKLLPPIRERGILGRNDNLLPPPLITTTLIIRLQKATKKSWTAVSVRTARTATRDATQPNPINLLLPPDNFFSLPPFFLFSFFRLSQRLVLEACYFGRRVSLLD